jgi:hypothetical protein
VLDSFFGNVCELDLVFNFYKVCSFGFWAEWFWRVGGLWEEGGGRRKGIAAGIGGVVVVGVEGMTWVT